jgi:hypothetical protein
MRPTRIICSCSLPLAALCALVTPAPAQSCSGTISATPPQISVTTGGVQLIDIDVAPSEIGLSWQVLGAFGTNNPVPWFASGGLFLNDDAYLLRTWHGRSGLVHGAIMGNVGGMLPVFDAAGHAQLQVVIPTGLSSWYIGRTFYHGMYRSNMLTLLPECGTPTVSLTLVP